MTTLIVIDGHDTGERRSAEVARRFRSELGALNISTTEAARRCNMTQAWMSRRTSGRVPFDVDDLDMVCRILGISYDYVVAGIRAIPDGGGPGEQPRNPPKLITRNRRGPTRNKSTGWYRDAA